MNRIFFGNGLIKAGFAAFALALGLVACGDGGSANGPSNNHGGANVSSVESEENLPSCTESREGFVRFIDETKEGFICKDRKWVHYDMIADVEENLPGCTGSREGLSAYLYEEDRELNCVEGSWDVVGEVASSSSSEKDDSSSSVAPSSSSVILSSSGEESSSSVASSSSEESSSSSVILSSSSSVIPGTDPGSSSSKANWAYLNPDIEYGEFTDERDGQVYKTVTIGSQTWMAENLNYSIKPGDQSWCGGGSDKMEGNCGRYGRLYALTAAMNACPSGWLLPDLGDWLILLAGVGATGPAITKLKAAEGWYGGLSGTNDLGFSVLPAGYRDINGDYYFEGKFAIFWTSTPYGDGAFSYLGFADDPQKAEEGHSDWILSLSIRCILDKKQ